MKKFYLQRSQRSTRRAIVVATIKSLFMFLLFGRLYKLQILESKKYRTLAEENRINIRLILPPRGRILDRENKSIAMNEQNYRLLMIPSETGDRYSTLDKISFLIKLTNDDFEYISNQFNSQRSDLPVVIKEHLSWEEVAKISENMPELAGVSIDMGLVRYYPFSQSFAHLIGYIGMPSEDDMTEDPMLRLPGCKVGRSGIELLHDDQLRGSAGTQQVEVNAHGRVIRELDRRGGKPGSDLQVTLDIDLQNYITKIIQGETAAAVVMDVASGEILASTSTPSFNPNSFNTGLTGVEWASLVQDEQKPLLNRATTGRYPPGSTFKLVVALAASELELNEINEKSFCNGGLEYGDKIFHCWRKGGHGWMNISDALAQSCDVYFYNLALSVGIENISAMAKLLGLGESLETGIPGEIDGLIPDKNWKRAIYDKAWTKSETINTSIGQGYVLATPLQLAVMLTRIVNPERLKVLPSIVKSIDEVKQAKNNFSNLDISSKSLNLVKRGMFTAVNKVGGTAYNSRILDNSYLMAGKTATSQVRRISLHEREQGILKNEELPWKKRDHALFLGYAPFESPRFVVSVVIEHGGSGSKTAAPIARDILLASRRFIIDSSDDISNGSFL